MLADWNHLSDALQLALTRAALQHAAHSIATQAEALAVEIEDGALSRPGRTRSAAPTGGRGADHRGRTRPSPATHEHEPPPPPRGRGGSCGFSPRLGLAPGRWAGADRDEGGLAVAHDAQRDRGVGLARRRPDRLHRLARRADLLAADADDHVSRTDAGLLGGRPRLDLSHHRALGAFRQVELAAHVR